jgi:hypothetical protein
MQLILAIVSMFSPNSIQPETPKAINPVRVRYHRMCQERRQQRMERYNIRKGHKYNVPYEVQYEERDISGTKIPEEVKVITPQSHVTYKIPNGYRWGYGPRGYWWYRKQ